MLTMYVRPLPALPTRHPTEQAEKENIALGGPKFYSPGTCPADFKFLHYGVHILGKNP